MCQFLVNSMPILCQFYIKMPLQNLYFVLEHVFEPPPPPSPPPPSIEQLNNVKKTGREGHPYPYEWPNVFYNRAFDKQNVTFFIIRVYPM